MPVKLELSDQHMQVIAEALGNMPLRVALPVVNEINRQMSAAQAAPGTDDGRANDGVPKERIPE